MVDDTPDTDEEDAGRRAAAPDDDRADGEADAPSVANPFGDDPVVDAGADDDAPDGDAADAAPSADDRASRGDAPFGDLARRVEERRHGPSESESESDPESDPFETVDVGEVDEDDLWASLGEESAAASAASLDAAESVDGAAGEANGRPEHVVDKRAYCQRCPFLSAPPAVACGHEGSTIVEAVDGDRFRVRGCPMVTEEEPELRGRRRRRAGRRGRDRRPARRRRRRRRTHRRGRRRRGRPRRRPRPRRLPRRRRVSHTGRGALPPDHAVL
ncbi:hypothetical protein ACFQRB_00670 [Halobaculum litoreum]|uniref:DUF8135 domain-containing protein n=1 Tax=Halobaculum litoreum TaxID=3031998 RepID=A0ABD5XKC6_9EURY